VEYKCKEGWTTDGTPRGLTQFAIQCTEHGVFSPLAATECAEISYQVMGAVKNAVNMKAIPGATVKFRKGDTEVTVGAPTSGCGQYVKEGLPPGKWEIEASAPGYITGKVEKMVEANVAVGTGADVIISPTLPVDGWRAVLTWGKKPFDLDSHMYFGRGGKFHMAWYKRTVRGRVARGSSFWSVLDVDNTRGYGPETTTLKGISSRCNPRNNGCKLVFKVMDYNRGNILDATGAKVALYHGDSKVATYSVESDGYKEGPWWTVFVIDAKTDTQRVATKDDR